MRRACTFGRLVAGSGSRQPVVGRELVVREGVVGREELAELLGRVEDHVRNECVFLGAHRADDSIEPSRCLEEGGVGAHVLRGHVGSRRFGPLVEEAGDLAPAARIGEQASRLRFDVRSCWRARRLCAAAKETVVGHRAPVGVRERGRGFVRREREMSLSSVGAELAAKQEERRDQHRADRRGSTPALKSPPVRL